MKHLHTELILPNGSIISNRIAKSAMSENLSNSHHAPTPTLINAYRKWAEGNPGLLITGNIMIDSNAIGEPRNVVVEDHTNFNLLKEWGATVEGTNIHLWGQINHPGRQAMEQINTHLVAPSAVPLKSGGRKSASKKIPRALTEAEILNIINGFGKTALILKDAGFTGVQIHGAHGYLVSQFLSPNTNIRKDKWGGNFENRTRFVVEVYRNIRQQVGADFPVSIKLNSADFQKGGFTEEESIEVVKILSKEGIDLIEISGGTYEAPAMMGKKKKSTQTREAYFIDYVKKARQVTQTPLMLTGGFRTIQAMENAVASNHLDLIGLARPFAVFPKLAADILTHGRENCSTHIKKTGIKAIDGAMQIIWYEAQIKRLGKHKNPDPNLSAWLVFLRYAWLILDRKLSKR